MLALAKIKILFLVVLTIFFVGCFNGGGEYPIDYSGSADIQGNEISTSFERQNDVLPFALSILINHSKDIEVRDARNQTLEIYQETEDMRVGIYNIDDPSHHDATLNFYIFGGKEGVSSYEITVSLKSTYRNESRIHFSNKLTFYK